MTLPVDVTRCHDGQCHARHQCERWTQRNIGHLCHHIGTLKPGYLVHTRPCHDYIGPPWPPEDEAQ